MPRTRQPAPAKSWSELTYAGWMLMGEASLVIWLRSMRLMMGGPLAHREAERMVAEKLAANMSLFPAVMAGGLTQTPEAAAARVLAHYGRPVRANRRRLARGARAGRG